MRASRDTHLPKSSKDSHAKQILALRWFKSIIIVHSSPNSEANPFTHMHKLQTDCTEIQDFKLEVNTFPLPLHQRTSCAEYSA